MVKRELKNSMTMESNLFFKPKREATKMKTIKLPENNLTLILSDVFSATPMGMPALKIPSLPEV